MLNRLRLSAAGCAAAAASLLCATSAHAALLTPSAQNCPTAPESQAFLAWGDSSEYFLAPDGNFAGGGAGWSLAGGASVVAGGDGVSLGGAAPSTQSLSLPAGSSATTPAVCVGVNAPTIRFMAENTGSPDSTLAVSATVQTTLGLSLTLPIGSVNAGSSWSPSAAMPILVNLLPLLPGNETPVTFTFTPQGQGGAWQVDDLYVDPFGRTG